MLKAQLKSILSHGGVYGVGRILSRMVGFLLIPVYTRYLTTNDYGTMEMLDLALGVLGIVITNGVSSSIFKFYHAHEDPDRKRLLVSTALALVVSATAAACLCVLALRAPLSAFMPGGPRFRTYLYLALGSFFFGVAGDIPLGYLRVRQRSALYTGLSLGRLGFDVALNLFLVVGLRWGVTGVLTTQLVSPAIFSAILLTLTLRETGLRFSWAEAKPLLRFGVPLIPSSLGLFTLNFGDRFFLNHFGTTAEVGVYGLGYKFGYMVSYLVLQPFMLIWDSKLYEIGKLPEAPALFGRIFTYLVTLLCAAGLAMSLGSDWIVRLMTARPFWGAADVIPVVILAYILQAFYYYFQVGLLIKGKTGRIGGIILAASLVTLALYYVLIRRYHALGAAWATVAGFAVMAAGMWRAARAEYPVAYEFRRVGLALGAAVALYAAKRLVPAEGWAAGTATRLGFLLLYPAVLWAAGFFHREEVRALAGLFRRGGGGARAT